MSMTSREVHQILRRLRDERHDMAEAAVASYDSTLVGVLRDEINALSAAITHMESHMTGYDLCQIDDETRLAERDKWQKAKAMTVDYSG